MKEILHLIEEEEKTRKALVILFSTIAVVKCLWAFLGNHLTFYNPITTLFTNYTGSNFDFTHGTLLIHQWIFSYKLAGINISFLMAKQ